MTTDDEIRRLARGALLPGFVGTTVPGWLREALASGLAGVNLFGSNLGDGTDVGELTGELRSHAGRDIVLSLDEEGGDVTRLDTVRGSAAPGAAALGALDDPDTTEEVYAQIGARLVTAGVTLNLAPVADVNVDPRNPVIGVRSFSADPAVAARHVAAAVRGLQRNGVAACVKHFPGHGATSADSHHGVARIDRGRAEFEAVELVPFRAGIQAGARSVMTGHLLVPALDPDAIATVSRPITTDLLRGELGFNGTIVTDALEMKAVSDTLGIAEGFVGALVAGADLIETGAQEDPAIVADIEDAVLRAVHDGRLSIERLQDAERRARNVAQRGHAIAVDHALAESAAARAVRVIGSLPALSSPVLVEAQTPNGVATGELPWSLAERVAALIPHTDVITVDGPLAGGAETLLAKAHGRSLVVVIRDAGRHEWQRALLEAATRHGDAIVVDVGWPSDLPSAVRETCAIVQTFGIAPGLLDAAAHLVAGR